MMIDKTPITVVFPRYQVVGLIQRQKNAILYCETGLADATRKIEHPKLERALGIHRDILRNFETSIEQQSPPAPSEDG